MLAGKNVVCSMPLDMVLLACMDLNSSRVCKKTSARAREITFVLAMTHTFRVTSVDDLCPYTACQLAFLSPIALLILTVLLLLPKLVLRIPTIQPSQTAHAIYCSSSYSPSASTLSSSSSFVPGMF